MCGNILLPVTQKACIPHFIPPSETFTMNNKYYDECKAYDTSDIIWGGLYGQGVIDTGIQ